MENSIKMLKQIEKTHNGLGIPILFSNISTLARVSNLYLAEKGAGKGTTIRSTKPINIQPQYDMNMDSMTMLILVTRMKNIINSDILWRIKEWTTFSQYHRNYFLSVGSQIITDHCYEHTTGSLEKKVKINIQNCNLTCLIGIPPLEFQRMYTENTRWESLASDRFIKYIIINPLRKDSIKTDPTYELPKTNLTLKQLPIATNITITRRVLSKQVTEERLPIYTRDLLNAYCIFEGYDSITSNAEIEFMQLFNTPLQLYPQLTYSTDIDKPSNIAIGALRLLSLVARHDNISLSELIEKFNIYHKEHHSDRYDETIMRHTNILKDRDLIQIEQNSPKRFHMSNRLNKYFNWYSELVN